ncbi:MAG: glycosyltransferase family 4 protein [Anaerolineales bacterium]
MAEQPNRFDGRVGLQQRVLPAYRVAFVDRLARACDGLQVFAGRSRPQEAILAGETPEQADWVKAENRYLFSERTYLLWQPGLMQWLRKWQPEVLILEANPRYLSNWRIARQARRAGIVVLGWGLGAPGASGPLGRIVWGWYLRRFDGVIAYSSQGAEQLRAVGHRKLLIEVAINAVADPTPALPGREPPTDRAPRLLFVGRLQERKGLDRLLQAAASLDRPVELRIVGDGPARSSLESLAQAALPGAVFDGALQGEALADAFRWADLFVLPGTGGLAVQQAMAYGLPVIVAEGDGTQRDLVRPENGWLVPAGDQPALAAVIEGALSDPAGLVQKGAASYRIVAEEINLDQMTRVFVETIRTARERS